MCLLCITRTRRKIFSTRKWTSTCSLSTLWFWRLTGWFIRSGMSTLVIKIRTKCRKIIRYSRKAQTTRSCRKFSPTTLSLSTRIFLYKLGWKEPWRSMLCNRSPRRFSQKRRGSTLQRWRRTSSACSRRRWSTTRSSFLKNQTEYPTCWGTI